MAGSFNQQTIIGYVGDDPEMHTIATGDAVAAFSVATTERRQDGTETTTWFRVSAFRDVGEMCHTYIRRGSYVYIAGPLSARTYTAKDGSVRTSLDVRAREVRLLDKRPGQPTTDVSCTEASSVVGNAREIGATDARQATAFAASFADAGYAIAGFDAPDAADGPF